MTPILQTAGMEFRRILGRHNRTAAVVLALTLAAVIAVSRIPTLSVR